jgi:adenylate kinase
MGKLSKILTFAVFSAAAVWVNGLPAEQGLEEGTDQVMETVSDCDHSCCNDDKRVARVLFNDVWGELVEKYGEKGIVLPKQVVFLNGAPGAGKGTNTVTVMRTLEIPNKPVEVSSLLNTPECEKLKEKGMLVGDDIVVSLVLNELLKPENARGVIIDGFPRTAVQAHFLKFLIQKLKGDNEPIFRMVNFSVSRRTSVIRQLSRGDAAVEQNKKAEAEGAKKVPVRATDLSPEAAARRYQIYEKSIGECISILNGALELYEINAEGAYKEVRNRTRDILSREHQDQ